MSTHTLPRFEPPAADPTAELPVPARIRARLRDPLYRNGYALVASSALTSALGLLYWFLAARHYSPAAVGVNAALISAMTLIANIAQLNMKSALNRFLPRAGAVARTLVIRSYVIALVASALAAVVFVAGLGLWAPRLDFISDRPELAILFVTATMAWTIFVLQDSVLAGIRQALWVPAENAVFSVAKVVLLIALAATAPVMGIFASWSLSIFVLVVPISLLLFKRLIPAHVAATRGREERVPTRHIARYTALDYVAYLITAGTVGALPLIVLQMAGAADNAYFFVSWTIAYGLYLVSSSMGMSMIAEASLEPEELASHTRRLIIESARLVLPAAAVVVIFAPQILGLMGQSYSDEAATLLRLLALSSIPWIVFAAYTNVGRVEQRMGLVVAANALLCGLVLAIGLPLLATIGIVGLGIAWLVAQCVVAVYVIVDNLWHDSSSDLYAPALRVVSGTRGWFRNRLRRLRTARSRDAILTQLRRQRGEAWGWRIRSHVGTLNDVAVSMVGPPGRKPVALLKQACSEPAREAILGEVRVLRALNEDERLSGWRGLVPEVLSSGDDHGRGYVVESRLPGTSAERLIARGLSSAQVVAVAEAAIAPLHTATAAETIVDAELLREWIDEPIALLRPVIAARSSVPDAEVALDRLAEDLRASFEGQSVVTSWVHGDLCPGNILMTEDGETATGLVDWERGRPRGLPQTDLIHLWMTSTTAVEQRELGAVVVQLLGGGREREGAAVGETAAPNNAAARARATVLMTWLHHAAGNVAKSTRYPRSRTWVRRNVDPVLASIAPIEMTAPGGEPAPAPRAQLSSSTASEAPAPRRPRIQLPRIERPRIRRPRIQRPDIDLSAEWLKLRSRLDAVPREVLAACGALGLAVTLWVISLPGVDPRDMTEIGLMSVLPFTFFLAVALITASFAVVLHRHPEQRVLLGAHVVALISFLHATPTLIYGTLRYSWAWKHVGIVDYIQRHGHVKTNIDYLDIYHNWPSFFGLNALLNDIAGMPDSIDVAMWGPYFFNLLFFGAVLFVFSGMTRDRRVIWLGTWLFFITDWVGQDYFAPQSFAFFLYLVVIGVVLRWPSPRPDQGFAPSGRWPRIEALARRLPPSVILDDPRMIDRWWRGAAVVFFLLAVAAIATSHALTSVMVVIALTALVLTRVTAATSLPFFAVAIAGLWMIFGAHDYVSSQAGSTLDSVRLPWVTTESSVSGAGQFSDGQAVVAILARGLVLSVAVLAFVGVFTQLQTRRLSRAPIVLALAPLTLFAVGDYGGEVLFRIYLFSLPFLAFLSAYALLHPFGEGRKSWEMPVLTAVSCLILAGGMLFAYYGKERQFYFTPQEVTAARYIDTHAPPNSMLISGSGNYPIWFKNYEDFSNYVTLSREPVGSQEKVIAHPVSVLSDWMSDTSFAASYMIITRSMKNEVVGRGSLPHGSLTRIEDALLDSPKFRIVYRNRDAVIFALANPPHGSPQ